MSVIGLSILLLSGCGSAGSQSDRSPSEEIAQEAPVKPQCENVIDAKRIDRDPDYFSGICVELYIEVIEAYPISDCLLRVNYDDEPIFWDRPQFGVNFYESYMSFFDCGIAGQFFTGDKYKVSALIKGAYTFETVLGATRTLASFDIVDLLIEP